MLPTQLLTPTMQLVTTNYIQISRGRICIADWISLNVFILCRKLLCAQRCCRVVGRIFSTIASVRERSDCLTLRTFSDGCRWDGRHAAAMLLLCCKVEMFLLRWIDEVMMVRINELLFLMMHETRRRLDGWGKARVNLTRFSACVQNSRISGISNKIQIYKQPTVSVTFCTQRWKWESRSRWSKWWVRRECQTVKLKLLTSRRPVPLWMWPESTPNVVHYRLPSQSS